MDETGYLQEGQIFVITETQASDPSASANSLMTSATSGGKRVLVRDGIIITRSPAMHPGDMQLVNAIDVPRDSPLQSLRNVVVFSQHGKRDLASQLSGGDLDGDLYNVIYDDRLVPPITYQPAEYPRVKARELDRPVTSKDMSDFFVEFMQSDQLGMLCNVHQQLADQSASGTLDEKCIKLASMASTAVDFSKTGIPVNMAECPKYPRERPDFMAPGPRAFVAESGEIDFDDDNDGDDAEVFEGLDAERRPMRYYQSEKILGQLYRKIDERQFLKDMQQGRHLAIARRSHSGVLTTLYDYVLKFAKEYGVAWEHHAGLARDIRTGYEDSFLDVVYNYSPTAGTPLSETEIFSGTILGRQGGAQGKPLRELGMQMRERFEPVVDYCKMRIIHGDQVIHATEYLDELYDLDDREIEALPRAIACLSVGVTESGARDPTLGELKSFRYIAAAVCLQELLRYRITTFGTYTLPKLG